MMSRYDNDVSMYQATPKQHLKINSCESYTEAVLKRSVSYKEAHISLVPLTIPLAVGVKAYLIYFLFHREFEGFFV